MRQNMHLLWPSWLSRILFFDKVDTTLALPLIREAGND